MRESSNNSDNVDFLNTIPLDLFELNPSRWRQLVSGELRPTAQRKLIDLVAPPCPVGVVDQLTLLRMAHAILPLHGDPLYLLGMLLTEKSAAVAVPELECVEIF